MLSITFIKEHIGLFLSAAGLMGSYALYGVVQEFITSQDYELEDGRTERFKATLYMLFVQCLFNALVALLFTSYQQRPALTAETKGARTLYAMNAAASATYLLAMFCSNKSLQFVDYPTQVLGKSCKPVAVLLIGLLVCRPFRRHKYISVALLCAGIGMFLLDRVKGHVSESFDPDMIVVGRLLIGGSLVCDGFTGILQDTIVSKFHSDPYSMMLRINSFAGVYLAVALLVTGSGAEGLAFTMRHPKIAPYLVLFSLTSAVGQLFIYYMVRYYGSLATTIVTTTRKFFTIILSIAINRHVLSHRQWIAVAIVFAGLGLHSYWGHVDREAEKAAAKPKKKM